MIVSLNQTAAVSVNYNEQRDYSMDATERSNKGKHKLSPSSCASSSYESDPCYSGEGSSSDIKKTFKKTNRKYVKGKGTNEKEKRDKVKALSVSNWDTHVLQRLGINYEKEAVSLPEMLETIKYRTKEMVKAIGKPLPKFIGSLEEYTKQALNFCLSENISAIGSLKTELEVASTRLDSVNNLIWKIRREESKLLESDENTRDLFEMWSSRIRDFMNYHMRFLADQFFLPKRESRFVQLFMSFSRIFFLDPELGSNERKIIKLGIENHSCVPDIRFYVNGGFEFALVKTIMVMLTEVKHLGSKKKNLEDDEEKFDLRFILSKEIQGQHGGALLSERETSALSQGVLGTICMGTEIIFTFLDMSSDHLSYITENGETTEHSCMISYTKPYDFLMEKDRNELLPVLFWLGYVQSCCYKNYTKQAK